MDAENTIGLIVAILLGGFMLYCLFRPEDL
jgi:K+-transporting ATPase KdpF subunit